MNPVALRLRYAEALLTGDTHLDPWPRCCAWLIRLAVEHAVRQLWSQRCPALAGCPMSVQLLALGRFTDPATAVRLGALWYALSAAAHHHHYDLAPTSAELRDWHTEAVTVTKQLSSLSPLPDGL
ncbi:MAG: hypothetical protein ACRDRN_15820 [Sciscionella sp.]